MPPRTRRAQNGPTSAQSKLSFKNRVTKPSDSLASLKSTKAKLNEPAETIITTEIAKQTTPEPEEPSKGKSQVAPAESPVRIIPSPSRAKSRRRVRRSLNDDDDDLSYEVVEKEALKVSDAQIKKYWKKEEDSRLTPRVHQQNLALPEKILRHFDLSSEYGPCIGILRSQRWKRAYSLGLNPPTEVLAVILKEDAKEKSGKKGEERVTGKIAYVDELGGGRLADIE